MNLNEKSRAAANKLLVDQRVALIKDSALSDLLCEAFQQGYHAGSADQYAKDHTRTSDAVPEEKISG